MPAKTYFFAVICCFLIGACTSDKGPETDRDFAIEDKNTIDHIRLIKRNGVVQNLNRKSQELWMLDDSIIVDAFKIDNLLGVMERLRVDHYPPKGAVPHILEDFQTSGIKTQIYDAQGHLLRDYLVGNNARGNVGTHMLMKGSNQPYVVNIKAVNGGVRAYYNLTKYDWEDKHFFRYRMEALDSIMLDFKSDPMNSYVITDIDDFKIKPMFPQLISDIEINPSKAKMLQRGFEDFEYEYGIDQLSYLDSVRGQKPYIAMDLYFEDGKHEHLDFYPYNNVDRKLEFSRYFPGSNLHEKYIVIHDSSRVLSFQTILADKFSRKLSDLRDR